MYDHWIANALVVLVTAASVALAVLVHYEGLARLNRRLVHVHAQRRRKVLVGVYGVILLHVVEIWLFGLALWLLLLLPDTGSLAAVAPVTFLDAVYLSAETFTTVGYGDLAPLGAIRFLAGTEALTGFILITWSASFLYLEMEQYWRKPGG
jgi:Ion channel